MAKHSMLCRRYCFLFLFLPSFFVFEEIFPNIFALFSENSGSNCFLIRGRKEVVLVDSSLGQNKDLLISSLEEFGLKPVQISLILHTHCHADHIGCSYKFPDAWMAMHEVDAKAVNEENPEITCSKFFHGTKFPKITRFLAPNQIIDFGNLSMQVIHTPGHTEGSVCFFIKKEGILFSGDVLFASGFGRTDLASGSPEKMVRSLEKLQKLPVKALLSGHGPVLQGKEAISDGIEKSHEVVLKDAFL